jgi:hypothetical protein
VPLPVQSLAGYRCALKIYTTIEAVAARDTHWPRHPVAESLHDKEQSDGREQFDYVTKKKRGTFNTRQSPHTLMRFFIKISPPPPPRCQLDVSRLSHSDRVTMQPPHSLHMGPIKQASRRDLGGQIVVTIPMPLF